MSRAVNAFAGPMCAIPVCAALGVTVAQDPRFAPAALAACLVGLTLAIRRELFWWDLLVVGMGGALLFDYGFANVGVLAGAPIPFAEVLLALLLVGLAFSAASIPRTPPFLFAGCFVALALFRLAVDLPVWGRAALRDFTLPLELGFLLVGYWALQLYGLERWIRSLRWIFLVCLGYLALYPWRDQLADAGPVVGLQHPVPLLGNYWSAGAVAASGFFFFALVRPFGRASYLLAAGFLPTMLLLQARGVYLAVLAAVLLLLIAGVRTLPRVWAGLVKTAAVGAIGLSIVLASSPQGRLGPVSPSFVTAHISTLWGEDGPSAGSFSHRKRWIHDVLRQVGAQPSGWFVGVGLGPDLTGGFRGFAGTLVRKPHNDYLEILARLGAIGLALFVGILSVALARILRAARRATDREAAFLWWVAAGAVVYIVTAATQPLLFYPYGTIPLFMSMGAGLAIASGVTRGSLR